MFKVDSVCGRNHSLMRLPANHVGRDLFVGDIHGQYDDLIAQLKAVNFNPDIDRVFCVGDLIDRGPASRECLNLLREPWFFAVLGNHEDFFVGAFYEDDDRAGENLFLNGGSWVLAEDQSELRSMAADYLANLPVAIELETACGRRVGVVHAACSSGVWGEFNVQADIWNRRIADFERDAPEANVSGIDVVVVGHNVVAEPCKRGNTVLIDTGAAKGCALTVWDSEQLLAFAGLKGDLGPAGSPRARI